LSTGSISIKIDLDEATRYHIYNSMGKVVINGVINESNSIINLHQLTKGLYFLKVDSKYAHLFEIK